MKEMTKGIIALFIMLAVAGSIYGYDVWKSSQPLVLKDGDFAEIDYILYDENHTVISSTFIQNVSYNVSFDDSNYTSIPIKIYFGKDYPVVYPEGWSYSDLARIEGVKISDIPGLYNEMKGMKEGEEKTILLTPENGFGKKVHTGMKVNTSMILGFNTTFEIMELKNTSAILKWMPSIGDVISIPQYWYDKPIHQPYWLWENATEVIGMNDTNVTLKTTPNVLDNLTLYPWWENLSTAGYNDSKIWITTTPKNGSNFTITTPYGSVYGEVKNVTKDKINVVVYYNGNASNYELNRTEVFDRIISLPRTFSIGNMYLEEMLEKGYSFHKLAGKNLYIRVKLVKIYRVD